MASEKRKTEEPKRKLSKAVKIATLPDAVVDGKFIAKIDSELVIERTRSGKIVVCICVVKKIEDTGLVHVWDDSLGQWYAFSVLEPPKVVKVLKL
jgi:hypothetical protein